MNHCLIYKVTCVNIREYKNISISCNLSSKGALFLCSFFIKSNIKRKRTVNNTTCYLTLIVLF